MAVLQLAALQWANSGNNMAGEAFQLFLRSAVARLQAIVSLLSLAENVHEIPGINLTLGGRIVVLGRHRLRQLGHAAEDRGGAFEPGR